MYLGEDKPLERGSSLSTDNSEVSCAGLIFSYLKYVEVIETVYIPPGLNNR